MYLRNFCIDRAINSGSNPRLVKITLKQGFQKRCFFILQYNYKFFCQKNIFTVVWMKLLLCVLTTSHKCYPVMACCKHCYINHTLLNSISKSFTVNYRVLDNCKIFIETNFKSAKLYQNFFNLSLFFIPMTSSSTLVIIITHLQHIIIIVCTFPCGQNRITRLLWFPPSVNKRD